MRRGGARGRSSEQGPAAPAQEGASGTAQDAAARRTRPAGPSARTAARQGPTPHWCPLVRQVEFGGRLPQASGLRRMAFLLFLSALAR
eukprot:7222855-Pyramimonas_sp.AAC.1